MVHSIDNRIFLISELKGFAKFILINRIIPKEQYLVNVDKPVDQY